MLYFAVAATFAFLVLKVQRKKMNIEKLNELICNLNKKPTFFLPNCSRVSVCLCYKNIIVAGKNFCLQIVYFVVCFSFLPFHKGGNVQ